MVGEAPDGRMQASERALRGTITPHAALTFSFFEKDKGRRDGGSIRHNICMEPIFLLKVKEKWLNFFCKKILFFPFLREFPFGRGCK